MRLPTPSREASQAVPVPVTAVPLTAAVPTVYNSRDIRNPRIAWDVVGGYVRVIKPTQVNRLVLRLNSYSTIRRVAAADALSAKNTQSTLLL